MGGINPFTMEDMVGKWKLEKRDPNFEEFLICRQVGWFLRKLMTSTTVDTEYKLNEDKSTFTKEESLWQRRGGKTYGDKWGKCGSRNEICRQWRDSCYYKTQGGGWEDECDPGVWGHCLQLNLCQDLM